MAVEFLENRILLTGADDDDDLRSPWMGGSTLTLSFAPDGTDVSGDESSLFSTLGAFATADWQDAITRAFQTWAQHINLDIGLVADGGQRFGEPGRQQGDRRFGDIRIGAVPMSVDTKASAVPHDLLAAGTWSGDVLFNSSATFASLDEVFRVALHEAGHVLGLDDHSDNPLSPMFKYGSLANAELTPDDISAIRTLYGQRAPDRFEGEADDDDQDDDEFETDEQDGVSEITSAVVTELDDLDDEGGVPVIAFADLHSISDVDLWEIPVPEAYSGPATIEIRTAGRSLLAPQITVLDNNGFEIASAASTSRRGDILTVTVDSVEGDKLFVRVDSLSGDAFAVGGYALVTTFDDLLSVERTAIDEVVSGDFGFLDPDEVSELFSTKDAPDFNDDAHENDDTGSSTALESLPGFVENSRYRVEAGLSDATDIDFYLIEAPEAGNVMTVAVSALERGGLIPTAEVFDESGVERPAEILTNGNGDFVIQVEGVTPGAKYHVKVSARNAGGDSATGNYRLNVRFGHQAVRLKTLATGSFEHGVTRIAQSLFVAKTELFHFVLTSTAVPGSPDVLVWLTIYDSFGNVVYNIASPAGETSTAQAVLLRPGSYAAHFTLVSQDGQPLPEPVSFAVKGLGIDEPLGPEIIDPTEAPLSPCPDDSSELCYPDGTIYDEDDEEEYYWSECDLVYLPDGSEILLDWIDPDFWYWYGWEEY